MLASYRFAILGGAFKEPDDQHNLPVNFVASNLNNFSNVYHTSFTTPFISSLVSSQKITMPKS